MGTGTPQAVGCPLVHARPPGQGSPEWFVAVRALCWGPRVQGNGWSFTSYHGFTCFSLCTCPLCWGGYQPGGKSPGASFATSTAFPLLQKGPRAMSPPEVTCALPPQGLHVQPGILHQWLLPAQRGHLLLLLWPVLQQPPCLQIAGTEPVGQPAFPPHQ